MNPYKSGDKVTMPDSISFCILNYGQSKDSVKRCIKSIETQGVPKYEILICGVEYAHPGAKFLPQKEWAHRGEVNKMRNYLCANASHSFIVLMDADVELMSGWYKNLSAVDCFDVVGCRGISPEGKRVVDWAYLVKEDTKDVPQPLRYDEWSPQAYIGGSLIGVRRKVLDYMKFNETLLINEFGEADFCKRAAEMGFRVGVLPEAVMVCHNDRNLVAVRRHLLFSELPKKEQVIVHNNSLIQTLSQLLFGLLQKGVDAIWYQLSWMLRLTLHERYFRHRGWAYLQKGSYDKAILDFNNALKHMHHVDRGVLTEILRGLGWAYYYKNNFDEAIHNFSKAIASADLSTFGHLQDSLRGRGWAYYRKGNLEEAIKDFSKAIRCIDSKDTSVLKDACKGRGSANYKIGNFKEAQKDFETSGITAPV